jgi:hypothetical protein
VRLTPVCLFKGFKSLICTEQVHNAIEYTRLPAAHWANNQDVVWWSVQKLFCQKCKSHCCLTNEFPDSWNVQLEAYKLWQCRHPKLCLRFHRYAHIAFNWFVFCCLLRCENFFDVIIIVLQESNFDIRWQHLAWCVNARFKLVVKLERFCCQLNAFGW